MGPGASIPLPARLDAAHWEWPLTNRASELEAMGEELARSRDRQRLVLVGGEPGIGKTRLVSEFATGAHQQGALVLYGRASEGLAAPYLPFVEALGHCLEHLPPGDLEGAEGALEQLARIVPAASERLGAVESEPREAPGGAEQLVLFAAVASLLELVARAAPIMVVLDDLHWADEGSLLLLQHLFTGRGELPVLFVATYRTTEVAAEGPLGRALAQLGRERGVRRVELEGLTDAETLSLLTDFTGHGLRGSEAELATVLQRETAGNPLFVCELVRSLIDTEVLAQEDGRWRLRGELAGIRLPATVTDVIGQRVEGLGEGAKEALAAAATIGQEFDPGLVEGALGLEPAEMTATWGAAERAALIAAGDGGSFSFTHPLVARAIYDGIGSRRRGSLHRRIAERVESSGGELDAAQLARHWSEAAPADAPKARAWAAEAGRQALDRFDGSAGALWFRRGLELFGEGEDDRARCECLIGLGSALRQAGEAEFRETLLEASRLAERVGDRELIVGAALANTRGFASSSGQVDQERIAMLEAALRAVGDDEGRERALLLARLAFELTFSGEWDRRKQLSDEALELARRLEDRAALAQVLTERFVTIWIPDTLEERLANTEEAVALADQLGDPWWQFHSVHWRSVGLFQAGALKEAAAAAARQDELARRLGDPTMLWISTYDRANFAIVAGRLEDAEALAEEAAQVATEAGQPDALPFFTSQLTNIRYEQGRLPELQPLIAEVVADNPGIPAFRAVLALAYAEGDLREEARNLLAIDLEDEFAEIPPDVTWLAGHTIYAHVAADLDDRRAAEVLYQRLAPWAEQIVYTGISVWGDVDHALGRLATVLGRFTEAEQHLDRSRDRYLRIGAPAFMARRHLDAARMLLARDEPDDRGAAADLLEVAAAEARRHGAATIERRARSLREHARAMEVAASAGRSGQRLRLRAGTRGAPEPEGTAHTNGSGGQRAGTLERVGERWAIRLDGEEVQLKDSKGIRYLARLLSYPGVEAHAVDVQAGAEDASAPARGATDAESGLSVRAAGSEDAGEVLDAAAKREYKARIEALEEEIEEAERFNDPERAERRREELQFIGRELAAAVGMGGRDRKAASQAERARVNVTRALRNTLKRISEHEGAIGGHLESSVRTGTFCCYEPPSGQEVEWEVKGAGV